ncbi:hypothetical protein BP5796_07401 [Coleophoma crateriformis]|uniref:MYND-type domain-containing protein n=1 Tax=Coleophoma crateriformis TaxID=565419 RepID=A0A3D8RIT2_9HELO|nr:hypothetical protein BP5796_07401 [Coleophoma crateriformis]
MDQSWDYSRWEPSDAGFWPWEKPPKREVERLRDQLIAVTRKIKELPYIPVYWLLRSSILLNLGFPELVAADAFKCMRLCSAGQGYETSLGEKPDAAYMICEKSKKIFQAYMGKQLFTVLAKAIDVLCTALYRLKSLPDLVSMCDHAIKLFPYHPGFYLHAERARQACVSIHSQIRDRTSWDNQKQILLYGSVKYPIYPWMKDKYRTRGADVIAAANSELRALGAPLKVRPSTIRGAGEGNTYGMFATKSINRGAAFLKTSHPFSISLEQDTRCYNCYSLFTATVVTKHFPCCPKIKYCSTGCFNHAEKYYHRVICGKDFSGLIERAQCAYGGKEEGWQYGRNNDTTHLSKTTGFRDKPNNGYPTSTIPFQYPEQAAVMLLRFLAICLQAGGHPLAHPIVAQLLPSSNAKIAPIWNMNGMVVGPIDAMTNLGIDVFANEDYDSWVIQTMW